MRKKQELALLILTILAFALLCVKSIYLDGADLKNKYSEDNLALLSEKLELSEGIISQRIVKIRVKSEDGKKYGVTARKYFCYVLPIGDSYYDIEN